MRSLKTTLFEIVSVLLLLMLVVVKQAPERLTEPQTATEAATEPIRIHAVIETLTEPQTATEAATEPTAEEQALEEIKKAYTDTVAYIVINELLEKPVYQKKGDEIFYLTHNRTGQADKRGELFIDFRNDVTNIVAEKNIIIYGHNMKSGEMFGTLDKYLEKEFYEKHRIIDLYTVNGHYECEVFAVYTSPAYTDYIQVYFGSEYDYQTWLSNCTAMSIYETDIALNSGDTVLTLSTCTPEEDIRLVVQAVIKNKNVTQ